MMLIVRVVYLLFLSVDTFQKLGNAAPIAAPRNLWRLAVESFDF